MLTFGTSVAVNNLLALRAFYTFLFNYHLHEGPSWLEGLWLPYLGRWVENKAIKTMTDLLTSEDAKAASLSLNDVSGDFFAVLYICQNPQTIVEVKTGRELFLLLADMALQFEKIKKPKLDAGYKQ